MLENRAAFRNLPLKALPPVPFPARSAIAALTDSSAAELLRKIAQMRQIAEIISPSLAQLTPGSGPLDPSMLLLKEDVLLIKARSSAHAAKIRQGFPGLLQLLQRRGVQVSEIRVRVQPDLPAYPEQGTNSHADSAGARKPGSPPPVRREAALRFAHQLASTLPDGRLRQSAARLEAALRKPDPDRSKD
jgi:hypothetical protein